MQITPIATLLTAPGPVTFEGTITRIQSQEQAQELFDKIKATGQKISSDCDTINEPTLVGLQPNQEGNGLELVTLSQNDIDQMLAAVPLPLVRNLLHSQLQRV